MPIFLQQRDTDAREHMDNPNCDREELFNTYRQFSTINSLISRWEKIYKQEIRPACEDASRTYRLLDIGFGGGDLPIKISTWARRDHINLEIIAIDSDSRAFEFVQQLEVPENVTFKSISLSELLKKGSSFDFVISNHLLHHLQADDLQEILNDAVGLSRKKVLFNDIERSDLGYLLFNLFSRPLFRSSFITDDGLTSIKRSYTARELDAAVPKNWTVSRIFPYRLLLSYEHE